MRNPVSLGELNKIYLCEGKGEFIFLYLHALVCMIHNVSEKYGLFESAPNNANIDGFPVEVYINGEFLGLYTFNMPKDAWMLGLDEAAGHLAFDADINSNQTFFKKKFSYSDWGIEVGEENDENLEKFNCLFYFVVPFEYV